MINILCSGSRGDIQPYIALAQQLRRLNLQVSIVAGASFGELIRGYGVGFKPLSADLHTADIDPELLAAARTSDNPLKMLRTFNRMKRYASLMTEEMLAACEESKVVVYHPGCVVGYFAAQRLGVPAVLASPFPLHATSERASVIAYGRYRLPNRLTYTMLQTMLWMAASQGVGDLWKTKFGRRPDHFGRPYERVDGNHPAVISCSNYVFSRPKDWSEHIHQDGYWFVEEDKAYTPSVDLAGFLADGKPPIYFGFGSVFHEGERDALVQIIAEALRMRGQRGVLSGMGDVRDLPSNLLAIGSVPHTWLFPRCAAVCHHGGAGTSAAGFRSGSPTIIVPFSNDQFAWGHRAHHLGVGVKPIPRRQLTASRLAEAIADASAQRIKESANTLAHRIGSEAGAAASARVIASCAANY